MCHIGCDDEYQARGEALLHRIAQQGLATGIPRHLPLGPPGGDPELMKQVSTVISTKACAKANSGKRKSLTFWSPTINLLQDPHYGREEQVYSEDPYLTGQMGIPFIRGVQVIRSPLPENRCYSKTLCSQ